MIVPPNTQSILLLTCHFSTRNSSKTNPLTPTEYGRFAEWLSSQSLTPDRLLNGDISQTLADMPEKAGDIERIKRLIDRGSALALALDKWLNAGIWIITRSDSEYPKKLKQRLGKTSPALFFGSGSKALLNLGGLAVIGSRNAGPTDLAYARSIGEKSAHAGISVISGGARGIDETAMRYALDAEGTAVGVLADSLLRASTSLKYRESLLSSNLTLISTFNPEVGFSVGNAMARNKYIYCIADASLVVHSGKTGGTWSGATENMRNAWVPLWVKQTDDFEAGNANLILKGGLSVPKESTGLSITDLLKKPTEESNKLELISSSPIEQNENANSVLSTYGTEKVMHCPNFSDQPFIDMFTIFLHNMAVLSLDGPQSEKQLTESLCINRSQLRDWLKRGIESGKIKKLLKPVRYQMKDQFDLPGFNGPN